MSEVEKEVRHFIERMKFDIKTTREYLGDNEAMAAVANAQESFIQELEEVIEESRGYEEF